MEESAFALGELVGSGRIRRAEQPSVRGDAFGVVDVEVPADRSSLNGLVRPGGGVRAATEFGASLIAADDHDLYLSRRAFDQLDSLVAIVPESLGPIRLRLDDDAWGLISGGGLAPRGAVGLDLLDSADPWHWVVAEELVANA